MCGILHCDWSNLNTHENHVKASITMQCLLYSKSFFSGFARWDEGGNKFNVETDLAVIIEADIIRVTKVSGQFMVQRTFTKPLPTSVRSYRQSGRPSLSLYNTLNVVFGFMMFLIMWSSFSSLSGVNYLNYRELHVKISVSKVRILSSSVLLGGRSKVFLSSSYFFGCVTATNLF